jgi:UTP--glucose-1-phosphate uridylyltransferase
MGAPPKVKTAVIAAAGHATRMWPASKAIPKELFPLGRIPVMVNLLLEFLDAGIRRVILVVGKQSLPLMEALLDASVTPPAKIANDPLVQRYQTMLTEMEFTVLEQTGNYGNGTPLIMAADVVGPEPCIYAFGDDVVLGENASRGLIDVFERAGCPVLAAQEVDSSRKSQFGILETHEQDGLRYVSRLLEKPEPSETASNLAAFGRYLVTPELMEILRAIRPGRDTEVWFTDSVVRRLQNGDPVCAFLLSAGKWYTVGDPSSYAAAVRAATDEATSR